ncbi:MAG TPA: acyl carrier protein [Pseudonocardiaceae bacterium]|nr:acyl carrier protein [Pseudonocardiaceae bacterium]
MTTNISTTIGLRRELEEILVRAAGVGHHTLAEAGDSTLEDLGLDSLAAMELQAVVRDRYGVRIPDESLAMSLPQVVHHITTELSGDA